MVDAEVFDDLSPLSQSSALAAAITGETAVQTNEPTSQSTALILFDQQQSHADNTQQSTSNHAIENPETAVQSTALVKVDHPQLPASPETASKTSPETASKTSPETASKTSPETVKKDSKPVEETVAPVEENVKPVEENINNKSREDIEDDGPTDIERLEAEYEDVEIVSETKSRVQTRANMAKQKQETLPAWALDIKRDKDSDEKVETYRHKFSKPGENTEWYAECDEKVWEGMLLAAVYGKGKSQAESELKKLRSLSAAVEIMETDAGEDSQDPCKFCQKSQKPCRIYKADAESSSQSCVGCKLHNKPHCTAGHKAPRSGCKRERGDADIQSREDSPLAGQPSKKRNTGRSKRTPKRPLPKGTGETLNLVDDDSGPGSPTPTPAQKNSAKKDSPTLRSGNEKNSTAALLQTIKEAMANTEANITKNLDTRMTLLESRLTAMEKATTGAPRLDQSRPLTQTRRPPPPHTQQPLMQQSRPPQSRMPQTRMPPPPMQQSRRQSRVPARMPPQLRMPSYSNYHLGHYGNGGYDDYEEYDTGLEKRDDENQGEWADYEDPDHFNGRY